MSAWAMKISLDGAQAAGALRLIPGISALVAGGDLWLRGDSADDALALELRKVAGERFKLDSADQLTPVECMLPIGKIPAGDWRPLGELARPVPEISALPGRITSKQPLEIRRSSHERPASLLAVTHQQLAAFVENAPELRLRPLRFALSADEALIKGDPLPPLAGMRYAESKGVAVPCGFELWPIDDPEVVAEHLCLSAGEVAMVDEQNIFRIIAAESFVALSRSAVRRSLAGVAP